MKDYADLLDLLVSAQCEVRELDAPPEPGVYAVFVLPVHGVPGVRDPGGGPLYIGRSADLAERGLGTHFATGQTGFSTLRRSLGALMSGQLDLHARPRGKGASDSNYRCFRFDGDGEQRLSDWMEVVLRVSARPVARPKEVEMELVALSTPPLNLTGWDNPDAPAIRAARRACSEEARRAESR